MIDANMTDSNIGARKNKSCRNHIWIVNGINHLHNGKMKHVQLVEQSYDFKQMFDSMALNITLSDLYDRGLNDDTLILLKEANTNITMSVNTAFGKTKPVLLDQIVAQGDLMAPLEAAVQVDSIARSLEEEDEAREVEGRPGILYRYMDTVPIPILSLMDDCYVISQSGFKAEIINTFMNAQSASKGLQFNKEKCKTLKVGGLTDKTLQPSLEVDSWDIKYDEDDNIFETEGKKTPMLEKQEVKYLGFVISGNARNVKNITARRNKSSNTLRNIKSMICGLGTYTVESGIIYFKSLLRSSLLYAAETYYNMTEQELRLIETKEEECLRKIIETGCKSPAAILYLYLYLACSIPD